MIKFPKRFSINALLLGVAALAVFIAVALPLYRRSAAPVLTDRRGKTIRSNTIFPVVSMRVFVSGENADRGRILLLHRRTKEVPNEKWLPNWFEPKQTDRGIPILGDINRSLVINGERLYPRADSSIAVVYASDEDAPIITWVPYSEYSALPPDDTAMLWQNLVEKAH